MVPVGTNSASSRPKIAAARFSNRFTVGSSPYTSSPTSAAAIAARISGVGRVTVSERKSINSAIIGSQFLVRSSKFSSQSSACSWFYELRTLNRELPLRYLPHRQFHHRRHFPVCRGVGPHAVEILS